MKRFLTFHVPGGSARVEYPVAEGEALVAELRRWKEEWAEGVSAANAKDAVRFNTGGGDVNAAANLSVSDCGSFGPNFASGAVRGRGSFETIVTHSTQLQISPSLSRRRESSPYAAI